MSLSLSLRCCRGAGVAAPLALAVLTMLLLLVVHAPCRSARASCFSVPRSASEVTGNILSRETGLPLVNVNVTWMNQIDSMTFTTTTNASGMYHMIVTSGCYLWKYEKPGYFDLVRLANEGCWNLASIMEAPPYEYLTPIPPRGTFYFVMEGAQDCCCVDEYAPNPWQILVAHSVTPWGCTTKIGDPACTDNVSDIRSTHFQNTSTGWTFLSWSPSTCGVYELWVENQCFLNGTCLPWIAGTFAKFPHLPRIWMFDADTGLVGVVWNTVSVPGDTNGRWWKALELWVQNGTGILIFGDERGYFSSTGPPAAAGRLDNCTYCVDLDTDTSVPTHWCLGCYVCPVNTTPTVDPAEASPAASPSMPHVALAALLVLVLVLAGRRAHW